MMKKAYTVAQVNSYIKNMFSQDYLLQSLLVRGEVSNCKYHSSGHIYFTLKDEKGTIACVMFAGNRGGLSFQMREGQQVVVEGSVDVYERDGRYQLYARKIRQDGAGNLYERFEQLKRELAERGMFAPEYKQPIPRYVRTVGIVTAATGAAVQDIIQIAGRRNPYVQLVLYPAIVQGDAAVQSIIKGIRVLEAYGVDVMIVGRGGGSIEDLWAFNEEMVAQAIFDCRIPVISAVGHETDTTIADFVADLRAPTPSAAAELAVYDIRQLYERLADYEAALSGGMQQKLVRLRAGMELYRMRLKHGSPESLLRENRMHCLRLEERMQYLVESRLQESRHRLAVYLEKMKGCSPLDRLNQGFSYVSDENGGCITRIGQVGPGDRLSVQVSDGRIDARVLAVQEENRRQL